MASIEFIESQAALIAALDDAVAAFGPDTRLLLFNQAYADLWRLERGWLETRPKFGHILERLRDNRRLPEQVDFQAYKNQMIDRFERVANPLKENIYLPDGTTLACVTSLYPGGGLVVVYRDITQSLGLERAQNEFLAVHQVTIDNLREGIAVFGGDGRLKLCNPAFNDLWALDARDLGRSFHMADFIDAIEGFFRDIGDWSEYRKSLVVRLMGREAGGGRLTRNDGRILNFSHVPLPDGAVLLTYDDVTATAGVETALRERAGALEAANRMKSEFLAKLSHEVRGPLNTISGFAELLSGGYFGDLNKRQAEYSEGIVEASGALMGLIADILDLANIEAGLLDLEIDSFDLHAALASVLGLVRERARRKKLTLEFDCAPDIGWISADERRIKQVILHLLNNAETFTPTGGTVTLAAVRGGGEMAITVKDTGVGIPKVDQVRVFQGFERGAGEDETSGEETAGRAGAHGAGLGLTLVRSFIDLHGGRVEISSRPGRGTRITCYLPDA